MIYYDFIYSNEEDYDPFASLVSFNPENWEDDHIPISNVNIESEAINTYNNLYDFYGDDIYGLEELSLQEAQKKGIVIIFTEF